MRSAGTACASVARRETIKYLFILNDLPYGTERNYNALRLARSLAGKEASEARMFLLGDAAASAHGGQKVPQGYYNVADMLSSFIHHQGTVSVCETCIDARGITEDVLIQSATRGTMDQLAEWTTWADKVLVF